MNKAKNLIKKVLNENQFEVLKTYDMLHFLNILLDKRPGLIDFDYLDLYQGVFKNSKIVSIINTTNKDDINLIKISNEMPTRGLLCLCENNAHLKGLDKKLAKIISDFNYNMEVRDLIYTIREDDFRIFGIFTKEEYLNLSS